MTCDFCYIPFDKTEAVDPETLLRIVNRCHEIGVQIITFGGGDPLNLRSFGELARAARSLGLFVHVDTNGLGLTHDFMRRWGTNIDLLGLPLDGATPNTHDTMRSFVGHFELMAKKRADLLAMPAEQRPMLKINTVVSKANVQEILQMRSIIEESHAKIWSLYQYWPLESNSSARQRHSLSNKDFADATSGLARIEGTRIELNPYSTRAHTSCFTSTTGEAYAHNPNNGNEYMKIGSIFDSEFVDRWNALGYISVRSAAEMRYAD